MPKQWHGRAMPCRECHVKENVQIEELILASEFGSIVSGGRRLKNLQVQPSGADQGGGRQQARSAALKTSAECSKKT